jgi:choline dehydrogenase-like flavoprotein
VSCTCTLAGADREAAHGRSRCAKPLSDLWLRCSRCCRFRAEEVYPSPSIADDDDIDNYIRNTVHSANALTGSCRMGSVGPCPRTCVTPSRCHRDVLSCSAPHGSRPQANDPAAVLDSEMRVRGVGSLRVIDASAMPHIIGGQTCAPTIMMAEKGADLVLHQRSAIRAYSAQAAAAASYAAAAGPDAGAATAARSTAA